MSRKLLPALLAAGLSIVLVHAARAENEDDMAQARPGVWRPHFVVKVPRDKMKAAYPKGAAVTGKAALDCVAAEGGKLADCRIAKEDPGGQGFGQAALSVVGYERIKTTDDAGAAVAGRTVRTFFEFLGPGDANPDWIRKPTGRDLAAVFPKKAIEDGVAGKATIGCQVTVEGFLQNCKVLNEAPADYNFGQAGLQLAAQFRLSPKIRGGKAVPGGTVSIPINWGAPNPSSMTASNAVLLDPPWSRAPTQAEINAVWPKDAAGVEAAQAALRCDLDKSGVLRDCDVISENPRAKGFGRAAVSLSRLFQIPVRPEDAKAVRGVKVDVPFRFRNPAMPEARKLTKPRWIRTLSPEGMAEIYPEAAVKAGVKAGESALVCTVTAVGDLADCRAERESPAGLDFGAAAIKAASLMRMNPWTKEGDTVEGLQITLPIAFTFEDQAPAAPGAPKQGGQP